MKELLDYLSSVQPGPISEPENLETLLAKYWHCFKGSNEEGMADYKLLDRIESINWDPPILSFHIERHGGATLGSTRAELQHWEINVKDKTAESSVISHRQLKPMSPRWNAVPVAEEIVKLIIAHKEDERLKWNKDGSVKVQIGKILPKESAVKATLEGRRKRLRKAIDERLIEAGWRKIRENVYAPNNT